MCDYKGATCVEGGNAHTFIIWVKFPDIRVPKCRHKGWGMVWVVGRVGMRVIVIWGFLYEASAHNMQSINIFLLSKMCSNNF
jgi:hypothetical protein